MPANLPPQYFEVEKNLRTAKTPMEKIAILDEMLAIMPKHKGTDHLRAELRAKIAKLTQQAGKKSVAQHMSLMVAKEGAAQVVVIGLPNTGKSQLVGRLTNASPAVADYPFTTTAFTPGMMAFENVPIQLVDTPPLVPESFEWWVPPMLRRADALLVMLDLGNAPVDQMESILELLNKMHIGLGPEKSGEEGILAWKKALMVGNKVDLPGARENYAALQNKYGEQLPLIAISARERIGLEELKRKIFQVLDVIRVYTKVPGQKPDLEEPIVLERGSTLAEAAMALHKDFLAKLKYARLWGSGKHDGIMVKRDHILQDGDIIELHV